MREITPSRRAAISSWFSTTMRPLARYRSDVDGAGNGVVAAGVTGAPASDVVSSHAARERSRPAPSKKTVPRITKCHAPDSGGGLVSPSQQTPELGINPHCRPTKQHVPDRSPPCPDFGATLHAGS